MLTFKPFCRSLMYGLDPEVDELVWHLRTGHLTAAEAVTAVRAAFPEHRIPSIRETELIWLYEACKTPTVHECQRLQLGAS